MIRTQMEREELVKRALYYNWVYGYNRMAIRDASGSVQELITYDEYKVRLYR